MNDIASSEFSQPPAGLVQNSDETHVKTAIKFFITATNDYKASGTAQAIRISQMCREEGQRYFSFLHLLKIPASLNFKDK